MNLSKKKILKSKIKEVIKILHDLKTKGDNKTEEINKII